MNIKQQIEDWKKVKEEISPWPWSTAHEMIYDEMGEYMGDAGTIKDRDFIASAPQNYDQAMQALEEAWEKFKLIANQSGYYSNLEAKAWLKKWEFEEGSS